MFSARAGSRKGSWAGLLSTKTSLYVKTVNCWCALIEMFPDCLQWLGGGAASDPGTNVH